MSWAKRKWVEAVKSTPKAFLRFKVDPVLKIDTTFHSRLYLCDLVHPRGIHGQSVNLVLKTGESEIYATLLGRLFDLVANEKSKFNLLKIYKYIYQKLKTFLFFLTALQKEELWLKTNKISILFTCNLR